MCFLRGPMTVAMIFIVRPGWMVIRSRLPKVSQCQTMYSIHVYYSRLCQIDHMLILPCSFQIYGFRVNGITV